MSASVDAGSPAQQPAPSPDASGARPGTRASMLEMPAVQAIVQGHQQDSLHEQHAERDKVSRVGVQLLWNTPPIPKNDHQQKPLQCVMVALVSSEKNNVDSTLGTPGFKASTTSGTVLTASEERGNLTKSRIQFRGTCWVDYKEIGEKFPFVHYVAVGALFGPEELRDQIVGAKVELLKEKLGFPPKKPGEKPQEGGERKQIPMPEHVYDVHEVKPVEGIEDHSLRFLFLGIMFRRGDPKDKKNPVWWFRSHMKFLPWTGEAFPLEVEAAVDELRATVKETPAFPDCVNIIGGPPPPKDHHNDAIAENSGTARKPARPTGLAAVKLSAEQRANAQRARDEMRRSNGGTDHSTTLTVQKEEAKRYLERVKQTEEEKISECVAKFETFKMNLPAMLATADRKTRDIKAQLAKEKNLVAQLEKELIQAQTARRTGHPTAHHAKVAEEAAAASEAELESQQLEVDCQALSDMTQQSHSEAKAYQREARTAEELHKQTELAWRHEADEQRSELAALQSKLQAAELSAMPKSGAGELVAEAVQAKRTTRKLELESNEEFARLEDLIDEAEAINAQLEAKKRKLDAQLTAEPDLSGLVAAYRAKEQRWTDELSAQKAELDDAYKRGLSSGKA